MAKKDALSTTFPIKIRYNQSDLADSSRLISYQKMVQQGFTEIERAIGDIYNTENAQNSVLSDKPLYINSLGRSIGSMANIVPPLSGIQQYSPTLANRLLDSTYNVIPHPDQSVKCEVGCKFDGHDPSDTVPVRKCLAGFDAFYKQQAGTNSNICQTTSCPGWSGRDGQLLELLDCDSNVVSKKYRDYKVVLPREERSVETYSVKYYSNCGFSTYDRFRIDFGQVGSNSVNVTDPSNTWAVATNATSVSGVSSAIRYDYPRLSASAEYIVVVEIPAVDIAQTISFNNISFGAVNSNSVERQRYIYDLSSINLGSTLSVTVRPQSTQDGSQAMVSQIWVIEKGFQLHRNYNIPLLLPIALDDLNLGTEISPNFVQIFDTDQSVNSIVEHAKVFASRFEIPGERNRGTNRESFDVRIFNDQKLSVGNDRYLTVTVGTDITTAVGALLEAFVEHVTDPEIHLTEERICQLLQDRTFCCEDKFRVQVASLIPSNRKTGGFPALYSINTYIYGAVAPYTVSINWGDNSTNSELGIVSGIQSYVVSEDKSPQTGTVFTAEHTYDTRGTYNISFVVTDDASEGFGCTSDISSLVSPFNVGSAPEIDLEVRLDILSSYPNHIFTDVDNGYNFVITEIADWESAPNYHVLTQVHNTDEEDGKPNKYSWVLDNPESLIYQFYYENVSAVTSEALALTNFSGTLANGFIQQDSIVLKSSTGSVYRQGIDYNVDFVSGLVTAVVGQSIPGSSTITANYYKYNNVVLGVNDVSEIDTNRWVTLNSAVNSATIDFADLTNKTDINTIRFKVRE